MKKESAEYPQKENQMFQSPNQIPECIKEQTTAAQLLQVN